MASRCHPILFRYAACSYIVLLDLFAPQRLYIGGLLEWRESLIAPIAAHIIVNGVNLHLIVSGKSPQPLNTPERAMDMNRDRDASEPEA